jgi:hypothetical protein
MNLSILWCLYVKYIKVGIRLWVIVWNGKHLRLSNATIIQVACVDGQMAFHTIIPFIMPKHEIQLDSFKKLTSTINFIGNCLILINCKKMYLNNLGCLLL